ncbi:hypothetical protein H6798_01000 [Candidatus Nomurabacteria bacterium]|nr:hypothetical protein [Candidatus Nomurabacteria bacterium]
MDQELIGFIADSCTTKISDGMSQIEATSVAVSANGTYGCNAKLNTSSLGKDTDWIVTITANDVNVSQTYSREEAR